MFRHSKASSSTVILQNITTIRAGDIFPMEKETKTKPFLCTTE